MSYRSNRQPITYIDYLQWIRDDLKSLMGRFDKMELVWSGSDLSKIQFYTSGVLQVEMIFTWSGGNLEKIERVNYT